MYPFFFFCLFREMNLSTNRGNDLLVKVLKYRYPLLMTTDVMRVVNEWLAADVSGQSKCRYFIISINFTIHFYTSTVLFIYN